MRPLFRFVFWPIKFSWEWPFESGANPPPSDPRDAAMGPILPPPLCRCPDVTPAPASTQPLSIHTYIDPASTGPPPLSDQCVASASSQSAGPPTHTHTQQYARRPRSHVADLTSLGLPWEDKSSWSIHPYEIHMYPAVFSDMKWS
jgi:hypothetical protein